MEDLDLDGKLHNAQARWLNAQTPLTSAQEAVEFRRLQHVIAAMRNEDAEVAKMKLLRKFEVEEAKEDEKEPAKMKLLEAQRELLKFQVEEAKEDEKEPAQRELLKFEVESARRQFSEAKSEEEKEPAKAKLLEAQLELRKFEVAAQRELLKFEMNAAKAKLDTAKAQEDKDGIALQTEIMHQFHHKYMQALEALDVTSGTAVALPPPSAPVSGLIDSTPIKQYKAKKEPPSGLTSASKSKPENRAWPQLVEFLSELGCTIYVNGVELKESTKVEETSMKKALSNCVPLQEAMRESGLKSPDVDKLLESGLDFQFDKLKTMSEKTHSNTVLPGVLKEHAGILHAVDSHEKLVGPHWNGPFGTDKYYCRKGYPDVSSDVIAGDIEEKSAQGSDDSEEQLVTDARCLKQSIERVVNRMNNAGYLNLAVSLAVTDRSKMLVCAKRLDKIPTHLELRITRLQLDDKVAERCWLQLVHQDNRNVFFYKDSPLVLQALQKLFGPFAGAYCRVKLLAESGSRVYACTLPEYGKSAKDTQTELFVRSNDENRTVVMKVVHDVDQFAQETEALKRLHSTLSPEKQKVFYYRGHVTFGDPTTVEATNELRSLQMPSMSTAKKSKQQSKQPAWAAYMEEHPENKWYVAQHEQKVSGGVILMRHGTPLPREGRLPLSYEELQVGVVRSLQHAHAVGVLHCDIRRSNVLVLDGVAQLIDYGLSVSEPVSDLLSEKLEALQISKKQSNAQPLYHTADVVLTAGSQRENVGYRLKEQLRNQQQDETTVQWGVADDYQMLLQMLVELQPRCASVNNRHVTPAPRRPTATSERELSPLVFPQL